MEKVEKWWERFMARDYMGFYYAQADRFYYDLAVLEVEPDEFFTVPAPLLADYLGLDHARGELLEFAPIYFRIWGNDKDGRVIDRDVYERWLREARLRKENRSTYERLSGEEKAILDKIRTENFVLDKTENQFGETIITEWISGTPDHTYYHHYLACWSSWWEGLGTCQCFNHDTFEKVPISVGEALELIKEKMAAES